MKKKELVKKVVGIDIGKDCFYACYKVKYADNSIVIKGTRNFENNSVGFAEFYSWSQKRESFDCLKTLYLMEATGVYYEDLAYFLYEKGENLSVQLAQKVKYFAKSCNQKTKTDKVDSKMIADFGIEKNLEIDGLWSPPSKDFKMIRDLCREHTSLKQNVVSLKSQLHALNHSHSSYKMVIEMKEKQISFCEEQILFFENEIRRLVKLDSKLDSKITKIETVKGLGFITIIKVLTEVNGFLLFKNIRQLVSYAGLDVVANESGKYKGKTKISKKGNARIRCALYMPAMSSIQSNKTLKTFYERINEGRTTKKQGVVAVMRKLLILIYTLWKKDEEYIEDYQVNLN